LSSSTNLLLLLVGFGSEPGHKSGKKKKRHRRKRKDDSDSDSDSDDDSSSDDSSSEDSSSSSDSSGGEGKRKRKKQAKKKKGDVRTKRGEEIEDLTKQLPKLCVHDANYAAAYVRLQVLLRLELRICFLNRDVIQQVIAVVIRSPVPFRAPRRFRNRQLGHPDRLLATFVMTRHIACETRLNISRLVVWLGKMDDWCFRERKVRPYITIRKDFESKSTSDMEVLLT
jgi:hypothetical protein